MDLHWAVSAALSLRDEDDDLVDIGSATCGTVMGMVCENDYDMDTEVPTDSERSDLSETPLAAMTPHLSMLSQPSLSSCSQHSGGLCSNKHWTEWSGAGADNADPYWLAVVDGHLQVMQGPKTFFSPPTLTESQLKPGAHLDNLEVSVPTPTPVRPPGIFFPPGLHPPDHLAVDIIEPTLDEKPIDMQAMSRTRTVTPNSFVWVLDARKLTSSDKVIVSPRFEFAAPGPVPFRVMLYPKEINYHSGSVSFRRSRGLGTVHLKSEINLQGDVLIDVSVGQSCCDEPIEHDFSETGVCRLPDLWNFCKEIDAATQTIEVRVSITLQQ
eukprot:TRINITY_DN6180_c0_g1_i1.p1 TRINITY_DN6180_c0_g1~~TRINITY_DN6180_c0_g1_i1.p1  ORF type:complete len:325 (+),score=39.01 TRINITY_DN6180_c0_g1_i1:79-1053(+)